MTQGTFMWTCKLPLQASHYPHLSLQCALSCLQGRPQLTLSSSRQGGLFRNTPSGRHVSMLATSCPLLKEFSWAVSLAVGLLQPVHVLQPAPTGMLCNPIPGSWLMPGSWPSWRQGISSYVCLACMLL